MVFALILLAVYKSISVYFGISVTKVYLISILLFYKTNKKLWQTQNGH